ncbi:MAG: DUF4209 domain-containing protein [Thermodesulfobacteriota bacterium]
MQALTAHDIIDKFDNSSDPFSEYTISDALRPLLKDETKEPTFECLAEALAFHFCENNQSEENPWGTYFGPTMVLRNNDGTVTESPSIKLVTPEMIVYWTKRATEAKHPILKARYADLVWDFSKTVTGKAAHFSMSQITIDSILDIAQNDLHEHEIYVIVKLKRALSLAISLNDFQRIEKVSDTIIAYEDKVAEDDKPGIWGFSYDLLLENKKLALTEEQKQKIINDLEARLHRLSNEDEKPRPWAAEAAAIRLANHYRKLNQANDVKRVLLKLGRAFEELSQAAATLQASSWLQHLHSVFLEYGLQEEAERIAVVLREFGPKVMAEMKPISHSMTISKEEMNKYVAAMIDGNMGNAFTRIAIHYVPKKNEVQNQLQELAKNAPLTCLLNKQIQDYKGRTVAIVGSVEHDLDGNIVHQMSQNMSLSAVFLRSVLESLIAKFDLSAKKLVDYLYISPIFRKDKKEIIETGLKVYLENNHLVAIHLIIPQIEDAIRNFVEMTGGSVLKSSRSGGFHLKTLDELLRDPRVDAVFEEDTALYLLVLLTDPRGWNLRNNVCHGTSPIENFGAAVSDRVIHALLCLALARKKEDAQTNPEAPI